MWRQNCFDFGVRAFKGTEAEWRRRTGVSDPSPEGSTAWRRESDRSLPQNGRFFCSLGWIVFLYISWQIAASCYVFPGFWCPVTLTFWSENWQTDYFCLEKCYVYFDFSHHFRFRVWSLNRRSRRIMWGLWEGHINNRLLGALKHCRSRPSRYLLKLSVLDMDVTSCVFEQFATVDVSAMC